MELDRGNSGRGRGVGPAFEAVGSPVDHSVWSFPGPSRKYGRSGMPRTVPPSETVRRVAPLMGRIGVSRVAEVTHLDRNGVPNFLAARPIGPASRGISYYNGKGASRSQARASAMMEAIERHGGEACPRRPTVASFEELAREAAAVDPAAIVAPRVREPHPGLRIEWVEGFDLIGRRPTFVPLNVVTCPYAPLAGAALFYASTNGLASGNTLEEATCQALCEVNERDAVALHAAGTRLRDRVRGLMAGLGLGDDPGAAAGEFPLIDPDTLPLRARRVHGRLVAGGLRVYLRDVTSETGIAAFACAIAERLGRSEHRVHAGYGSHPDARVAAVRALTEASSSRIAFIQGGREDLPDSVKAQPYAVDPDETFGGGPVGDFAAVPSARFDSVAGDVAWILGRLQAAGFTQAVAVDLTRPEVGIPVARVVVPGAESWSAVLAHGVAAAIGPRCLARLGGAAPDG